MARKKFFDEKIIAQINAQISIIDIAEQYGLTLVEKGDYYSLKEADSVVIYPETNSFFRHSNHHGGDVFKFIEEFHEYFNMSFKDVYFKYMKKIDRSLEPQPKEKVQVSKTITERKTKNFDLNESLKQCEERERILLSQVNFDKDIRHVKAYLIQTRAIRPDVVDEFIKKGLIKQAIAPDGSKNVVFIGYNDVGFICAVNKKSCSSKGTYKGDASRCNYAFGWRYDPDINDYSQLYRTEFYDSRKSLVCFEGYIDMLAYISTLKDMNIDYRQYSYLVCGSTSKYRSVIATAKSNYYQKVIIAFDNDKSGDLYAKLIAKDLYEQCGHDIKIKRHKSKLKDWDDDRKAIISSKQNIAEQKRHAEKILKLHNRNDLSKKIIKQKEKL